MKTIYLILFSILLSACGASSESNTENPETASTSPQTENDDSETNDVEEKEVNEYADAMGTWTVSKEIAGVKMDLDLREDGTYSSSLGESTFDGTWENIGDGYILLKNKNIVNGQKWKITESTPTSLKIIWNPDSKDPKEIPFSRP